MHVHLPSHISLTPCLMQQIYDEHSVQYTLGTLHSIRYTLASSHPRFMRCALVQIPALTPRAAVKLMYSFYCILQKHHVNVCMLCPTDSCDSHQSPGCLRPSRSTGLQFRSQCLCKCWHGTCLRVLYLLY